MSDLPATTTSPGVLVSFIERAAKDPDFDVSKFEALLRMQQEVEHGLARRAFNRAMASAQSEMLPVIRDAKNSHLGNKYAKLETIDAALRPIYTRHGFSVRYGSAPSPHEGWMRITCTVAHDDGYFEENYLDSPVSTTGSQGGRMAVTPVQAIGSTVTYLRRYLLGMIWNAVLADEDDDGEFQRRPSAAPAAAPRAPRVAEKTASPQRTEEAWRIWVDKLRQACAVLYSRQEVVEIGERASVTDAIATGPGWVRAEVSKILAENYARFRDEPEAEEPTDDLAIHGEEKLAAG